MRFSPKSTIANGIFTAIGTLIIIVVWLVAFHSQKPGTYLIPDPLSTGKKVFTLFIYGEILKDTAATLSRMLAGYSAACVVGIMVGLLLGSFPLLRRLFDSSIDFFRSIPVTALYPVFVLVFGIGSESKIGMIFWSSFFVICINATYGVIQTNPIRRKMAHLYGANWTQVFFKVTIFDALPQIVVGMRVAISYSLIVSILTEMFMGSQYGIGQRITESYNLYQIDTMFALILITGILGYFLNLIFLKFETKVIRWASYAN